MTHSRGCEAPSVSAMITLSGAWSTGKEPANDDKGFSLAEFVQLRQHHACLYRYSVSI